MTVREEMQESGSIAEATGRTRDILIQYAQIPALISSEILRC